MTSWHQVEWSQPTNYVALFIILHDAGTRNLSKACRCWGLCNLPDSRYSRAQKNSTYEVSTIRHLLLRTKQSQSNRGHTLSKKNGKYTQWTNPLISPILT